MDKVARRLYDIFGVRRSKEQLRKRWSDLKLREPEQLRSIKRMLGKSKYFSCVPISLLFFRTCMLLHVDAFAYRTF